ncbi:MAG: MotA/TolQ/ExbB proton channel family protein [Bacteroidetes bacterium]|nr:MAG: MotA/TolQ/ExbB proton channel family protein [Bacteroidota bacterium]
MLNSILLQIITSPSGDSASNAANTVANAMLEVAQPVETSLSLYELLMKGGYVMIPIGILLLLAIYIFIERVLSISRTGKADANFMNNIKDMLSSGNIDAAKTLCKHTSGPQAAMVEKGMRHLGKPVKEIEESMQGVAQQELYRLEKNMSILSIVGRVAPMMGFIGTIIGVINIFYKISLSKTVEIDVISEGLYQKMISSACGLSIGIFAFICYYIVQIMVDKRVHGMEKTSVEFMDILSEPNK